TVSEDAVDGYTTTISGYDITNTHKVEKITIEGTKTWEDNNDQDGIRPNNIVVRLYADGKEVANKKVTKKDNWKYSFTNLDKNKDGKEIKYTVSEDAVDGYTTTINGFNITNSYEPEVININGVKTWDDNNNQDGIRPDSIVVRLYADDVEIEKKKVSAQDNWSYEFTNLDKKKNGKEIKYTISEDAIDGYTTTINGFNIVNTHTPETTKVMGKKIWNDNNNQDGIRPDSIVVRLYADGEYVAKADITSGVNNDWTYAFIDLPKYNNGKEIKYTVSEDAVNGYNTSYSEENEYVIINTHLIEKTSLNGVKTWDDNNNQDGIRPDFITVRLYADGVEIENKKVTANDNWKYNFTDLDKYKDGQLVSYTITEDLVKGYSTVIDNNNITNTHEVEKINVSGTKTWDDNNNQDGIRPDFITVNLYGNNELLDSVVVNEESNWTYEFTNLDKYKDGYEIVYDVTEEIVDGYETTIEDFNITNTHIPEKITFKATKVWDDNNNQDGIRQSEIVVKLYKNDELFKEVTINEENNWTYSFVDLDRYENGIEIVYTVVEDVVLGYDTVIDYTEIDANNIISATITNTHIPEKTELNVRKIWLDRDNIMGLRPDNIEVDLYADGNFVKTVVISKDNNWNYLFDDLDKYQNGNLINYTFMEKPVYGYTTTYERSYIINTLDNYIYPENPEILPPQTGVKTKKNTFEYITLAIIGLFIFKQKNA
ncbi:MAG: Cna B-type domain-containing protein, partial [Bacilli bacterium]|nr:Cna B-type domain-containing protein [Bacilli bacterium]